MTIYSFAGLIQKRLQKCTIRNAIANASKNHIPSVMVLATAQETSQIMNNMIEILNSHIAHPMQIEDLLAKPFQHVDFDAASRWAVYSGRPQIGFHQR